MIRREGSRQRPIHKPIAFTSLPFLMGHGEGRRKLLGQRTSTKLLNNFWREEGEGEGEGEGESKRKKERKKEGERKRERERYGGWGGGAGEEGD